jgi:DNA-binding NtrC family response regulator
MRLNPATRLRVPPLRERLDDLPELVRFAFLEALRSEGLRPLTRQYLARFPTPQDFREEASTVIFGRPMARAARGNAFSVFISKEVLGRLKSHGWPGNHRELRLFATNALVYALGLPMGATETPVVRAPAVLAVSDHLVDRLLGSPAPILPRDRPATSGGGRRVEVDVPAGTSFSSVSADVERQYMRALFQAVDGDLERMAKELLGPRGSGRQMHLRLNQLGLRLRELRADGDDDA